MPEVLIEVAKQVPSLAVLAWIVWVFIGHLEKRNASQDSTQEKTVASLDRNTEALGKNAEVMRTAVDTIQDLVR